MQCRRSGPCKLRLDKMGQFRKRERLRKKQRIRDRGMPLSENVLGIA